MANKEPLSDNLDFLMFENFNLNYVNFREELKMVSLVRSYQNHLNIYYDSLKKNIVDYKTRNLVLDSPKNLYTLLKRHFSLHGLIREENQRVSKVKIFPSSNNSTLQINPANYSLITAKWL